MAIPPKMMMQTTPIVKYFSILLYFCSLSRRACLTSSLIVVSDVKIKKMKSRIGKEQKRKGNGHFIVLNDKYHHSFHKFLHYSPINLQNFPFWASDWVSLLTFDIRWAIVFLERPIETRVGIVIWGVIQWQKKWKRPTIAVVTGNGDDADGQFVLKQWVD